MAKSAMEHLVTRSERKRTIGIQQSKGNHGYVDWIAHCGMSDLDQIRIWWADDFNGDSEKMCPCCENIFKERIL